MDLASEAVDVQEIRKCALLSMRDLKESLADEQVGKGYLFRWLGDNRAALKIRGGDLRCRIRKVLSLSAWEKAFRKSLRLS